ncbi:hypothetical protein P5V15_011622 [Pogonomyrmex californicus]
MEAFLLRYIKACTVTEVFISQIVSRHGVSLEIHTDQKNQRDWNRWVPLGLLAYRSSKHEVTDFTPAELNLGRKLRLPLDLLRGCPPEINVPRRRIFI